ncbi:MAG: redoxin domain-containing protein [Bacteriovoracaceae bacterium]|nr:redoxin domain-containing protein [Bacteriovoracaceae bacterium]
MNSLKRIFIVGYLMSQMGSVIYSIYKLITGSSVNSFGPPLLSAISITLFIGSLMLFQKTARTSRYLWYLWPTTILGCFLSYWYSNEALPMGLSSVSVLGLILYVFWYSNLSKNEGRLKIGQVIPSFELRDLNSNVIQSSTFLGHKNLFLFFRGNWCPLCMAQIKEVQAHYQKIIGSGCQINLISPQSQSHTQSLAHKLQVDFKFYRDESSVAAIALGIKAPKSLPLGMELLGFDSDTVLPTIIVTDDAGKVIYFDVADNYRVRPGTEEFLKFLNI